MTIVISWEWHEGKEMGNTWHSCIRSMFQILLKNWLSKLAKKDWQSQRNKETLSININVNEIHEIEIFLSVIWVLQSGLLYGVSSIDICYHCVVWAVCS